MGKEKTGGIYFKVSDRDRALIEQKMELANVHNMSAYIRKMCIDGYIIRLDLPELDKCAKYLRAASNNLNQIARRVNSGGGYYPDKIDEIQTALAENRALFGSILEQLSKIN
ncbi:plasmid mobilization relaxosome protein MobC [Clostridium sp. AM58-1XD]|uniref:plasmid mobilization protein n=1 Tax=Clostridium sp. AM58-1XD TaxID=2292307 RepID=UPI000E4CB87D|nr:plasmid mobilization relaxosome protein MobC [Clostridium sp. AM58-1XD]RGY97056.1 plasmid mobilization relaxosome protein MobC [Clostridium sp. AM58-1XD]